MSTATMSRPAFDPTCPAPPPPPPPPPTPKFDERTERAIEIACQGPPFPAEVIAALRSLLPPVGRTNPHPQPSQPQTPPPPRGRTRTLAA